MVTPELDSKDTKLVTDRIDAGIFRVEDPTHIGGVLWAATHGAVSLELAGYEGAVDAQRRCDELCVAAAASFMVGTSRSRDGTGFGNGRQERPPEREVLATIEQLDDEALVGLVPSYGSARRT